MLIYCLLGKSSSGKSTIESEIQKKGLLDRIISTTSRPMRSNEIQGESYHYITKDEFIEKLKQDYFLEHTEYNVAVGDTWYYGIDKTLLDENKNYITVVNPDGFRQLREKLGEEKIIGILIESDDRERLIRSLYRENNPNCAEISRRYLADELDFQNIENEVKYIIKNNDLHQSIKTVEKIIKKENRKCTVDFETGTKVRITKILNTEEAEHLLEYVGRTGHVFSKIKYKDIPRYKILFCDDILDTAYFRTDELEVIQ